MTLTFYLQQRPLAQDPPGLCAPIIWNRLPDIKHASKKMRPGINRFVEEVIRNFLSLLFEIIADGLAKCGSITLPLARFRTGITELFNGLSNCFDACVYTVPVSKTATNLWASNNVSSILQNAALIPCSIRNVVCRQSALAIDDAVGKVSVTDAAGVAAKASCIAERTNSRFPFQIPETLIPGTDPHKAVKGYDSKISSIRPCALNTRLVVMKPLNFQKPRKSASNLAA